MHLQLGLFRIDSLTGGVKSAIGLTRLSSSYNEVKLKVLLDVECVGGLLGPEELATSAAGAGAAAADEDEKHEA